MAIETPRSRKDCDKAALNNVVLWCCSVFLMALCGYGLYRQHCLEQRVIVLEEQQVLMKRMLAKQEQPADTGKLLRREARDANDCICPPGKLIKCNFKLPVLPITVL